MAEYTVDFTTSEHRQSYVKPITEYSWITLGDLVIVAPYNNGEVIQSLEVYFHTPATGGFMSKPEKKTYADIPEELYKDKLFFAFRPSDYFTEDQIHDKLVINGKQHNIGAQRKPLLRLELDNGVHIDKDQWQAIGISENITLTTDPGVNITSITFDRYMGSWSSLRTDLADFWFRSYEDTWGIGKSPYTFNFREYYTPSDDDDLFFVLRVETDASEGEEVDPITLPLTKDIKKAYIDPDLEEVSNVEDSKVTIHSDHLHYISLVEIVKGYPDGEQVLEIELVDDRLETLTLDLADYLDEDLVGIGLRVRADKPSSVLIYVTEETAHDQNPATVFNATVHPSSGSPVNGDYTVVITADEGLAFADAVQLRIRLPEELRGEGTDPKFFEEYSIYPEDERYASYFNEDKTVIRIPLADFWIEEYYTYPPTGVLIREVRATEKKLTDGFVTSYATTYKMSRQSLDIFSNSLLNLKDYSFMNSVYNRVHSLFMIPFKIPSEMLSTDPKRITQYKEGSTNVIDAEAHYTLDNKYILPLGAIEVEGEYGNVYDYKDTQVYLHSPYIEQPIGIDPSYAIDETITLNMAIDLYSGNATLNIHSTKIEGELVQRVNIPIKHEIPLMTNTNNIVEGKIGGFIYNKITTPFIEVVRNIPYQNDSMFGKAMFEYGRVGDFSGYLEMDDTNVLTDATTAEQDMIRAELTNGVIIRPQD